jgi:hypothetical protein
MSTARRDRGADEYLVVPKENSTFARRRRMERGSPHGVDSMGADLGLRDKTDHWGARLAIITGNPAAVAADGAWLPRILPPTPSWAQKLDNPLEPTGQSGI